MEKINLHIIEPLQTSSKINSKRFTLNLSKETLRHVAKLSKETDEDQILKAERDTKLIMDKES